MFTGRTCKAAEMLTLRKTPTYKTLTSQIFMSAKLCYQQKSPPHTHTDCVKHFPVYSFELGSFQMRGGGAILWLFPYLKVQSREIQGFTLFQVLHVPTLVSADTITKRKKRGKTVVQKFYECDKPTQRVGEVCMRLQLHYRKQQLETMMST